MQAGGEVDRTQLSCEEDRWDHCCRHAGADWRHSDGQQGMGREGGKREVNGLMTPTVQASS